LEAVYLGLLVERCGGGRLIDPLATLAGALRLLYRVTPGAVQLHDLRAMHQAKASEGDHLGLLLAPLREGGGPLAGVAQRVHLLTGLNHAAIDQARDDGRQLPCGDRDHDFVQQRQPLLDLPLQHSHPALLVAGAGDQVCLPEALADLDGADGDGVRDFAITGGELLLHDRQQQVAPLDAVTLLAFEQPLGTGQPSGRAARLSSKEKTQTQPERAAGGSAHAFASIKICVMGAIKRTQIIIVPTDQIR
jgi:hypothetical protein